jgi:beta-phosphoglucomutase-like phosphatase (HAD superfamily)
MLTVGIRAAARAGALVVGPTRRHGRRLRRSRGRRRGRRKDDDIAEGFLTLVLRDLAA